MKKKHLIPFNRFHLTANVSQCLFPKAPAVSVSLMADLGEKQDLLQKNGPVSVWDWAPSPLLPFPTSQMTQISPAKGRSILGSPTGLVLYLLFLPSWT